MSNTLRGPKSIEEIVKDAQNFDHKTSYPLRIALRTAQNMLNQAVTYERDANAEAAYLFFYRHAEFYFSLIAKHPDAKLPEYKPLVARVRDEVNIDITRLEALKPELKKRYERYQQVLRTRDAARAQRSGETSQSKGQEVAGTHYPDDDDSHTLNAGQHDHLALKIANRELRRREAAIQVQDANIDDLSRGIRDIGRQLDESNRQFTDRTTSHHAAAVAARYNYPTVPHAHDPTTASQPPSLPPKAVLIPQTASSPPALPSKSPANAPSLPAKEDLSTTNYTFAPSAKTEGGLPLRTLFLPTALRSAFLDLAAPNTRLNLETCGILAGTLISNAFFVSRLVIPAQTSTSDTCEVTEEGDIALFDYVDGASMTVCGWIHTHPSQTCFLSSRDLHTSVGYQVMLPESVAIVCAPSKSPDHGIFRLTDPTGKDAILSCHQPGLFHPHAQSNLYTDALRPGHVCELEGLQFEVVDMRKKG